MKSEIIRPTQLAAMLSVSRSTVYRWGNDKNHPLPPPISLGKRLTGWKRSDIESYLNGLGCESGEGAQ